MKKSSFYYELLEKFRGIVEENSIIKEKIEVTGRSLTPQQAIGNPQREDYPILKGKEVLMEAEFKGAKGQAFTDMPGHFSGTVKEIINRPLKTNFDRAVLISTLNAVCRYLNIGEKTVHCKDEEPEECSKELVKHIQKNYGSPKIALIGLQPSMLQRLSENFQVRVVDIDRDNIGKTKFCVRIEDGESMTEDLLKWCDIALATGSTIVNSTIINFLRSKPIIFYGTTIAGTAALMNLNRFCECGK